MPVLAGTWLAGSAARSDVLIAALVGAIGIQAGTNLWNDAADAARGVDGPDRLGPPRMTAMGVVSAPAMHRAAGLAFVLACLAGLYLIHVGGWSVLIIGIVSLALGYAYSMGPVPLSGLPIGELLVIAFFGVVAVSGTLWLHGGDAMEPRTLWCGVMVGLPAAAILMLNNHRDRVADARAGRRTLAILVGEAWSRRLYVAGLLGALLIAVLWAPTLWLCAPAALLLWLSAAMLRWPVSERLNWLLPGTAAFQASLLAAVVLGGG